MPLLAVLAAATALHSFDVPKTLGQQRIAQARDRGQIAILLPQTIKSEFSKLYPTTLPAAEGRFAFVLGAVKNCTGASVCGVANFYGIKGDKPSGGVKVKLAKNHTGRYKASKCGANCSFPSIEWRQDKVLYTIEYKESAGKKNMVSLANSAITAGPR